MMSLSTHTLFPLISTLGWFYITSATEGVFQLQPGSTINGTLELQVPSESDSQCGVLCGHLPLCRAFSRDADGTCSLYRDVSGEGSTGVDPGRRSYRLVGPGRCLPDFFPCEGAGVCLRHLPITTDYSGAVTACQEIDARLTLPRVEAHNECLRDIYAGTFLWMGAVDPELNGIYYGIDGLGQAPTNSSWWGPGERDHAGATTNPEPNVIFVISYWADASAAAAAQPVCETPVLH